MSRQRHLSQATLLAILLFASSYLDPSSADTCRTLTTYNTGLSPRFPDYAIRNTQLDEACATITCNVEVLSLKTKTEPQYGTTEFPLTFDPRRRRRQQNGAKESIVSVSVGRQVHAALTRGRETHYSSLANSSRHMVCPEADLRGSRVIAAVSILAEKFDNENSLQAKRSGVETQSSIFMATLSSARNHTISYDEIFTEIESSFKSNSAKLTVRVYFKNGSTTKDVKDTFCKSPNVYSCRVILKYTNSQHVFSVFDSSQADRIGPDLNKKENSCYQAEPCTKTFSKISESVCANYSKLVVLDHLGPGLKLCQVVGDECLNYYKVQNAMASTCMQPAMTAVAIGASAFGGLGLIGLIIFTLVRENFFDILMCGKKFLVNATRKKETASTSGEGKNHRNETVTTTC
ncbi:hypothetical protein ElyMa_003336100 [Elysia marginata]|uniref:ZP domain-containing protein n=1 Tax=Elysia marginata TaxID=1093978 RepID=A0AAV4JG43_9GAST|nr:hypothetical protein ElyMa_003336100 [Elysia marginata]